MTSDPRPVKQLIGYRLKQAQSALRSRMDDALRALGLTTPQYSCLDAIGRHPGASTSDVARSVFVTRQTMNTLLRGLAERGLIVRAADASGRAIPLTLTPRGRALLDAANARIDAISRALDRALDPAAHAALLSGLARVIETLEDLPEATDL